MKKRIKRREYRKKSRPGRKMRIKRELIPLAAILVVAFYISSLAALYKIYPLVFPAGESHAETKKTKQKNDQGTASRTSSETSVSTTENGTSSGNSGSSTKAASKDIKPVLKFANPKNGDSLSSEIKIESKISHANSIEFYTEKSGSLSSHYVGKAKQTGDNDQSWILKVDTTDIPNGKYRLYAKIANDYGKYESDSITVTVNNETSTSSQDSSSQSESSQESGNDSTSTSQIAEEKEPSLKFVSPSSGNSVSGECEIKAQISYASKIKAILKGSSKKYSLGNMNNVSGENWRLKINTEKYPNGSYTLSASITNKFGVYNSSGVNFLISNQETSSSSSGSSNSSSSQGQTTQNTTSSYQSVEQNVEQRVEQQASETGNSTSNTTAAGIVPKSLDSDQDGLSNDEEKRLGTDPDSADTDKDGYLDGDEVKKGSNPLKAATNEESDKIVYESPKEKGETKKDLLKVESVQLSKEQVREAGEATSKAIVLKGKGLPFSFVTIYVYSETPTIVTVSTDSNGNWQYELDKTLEDGKHEAYVAITDNEGHVTAKSEPFVFIKTAQAVTAADQSAENLTRLTSAQSPMASSRPNSLLFIGVVIIISIFAAIALIGLYILYYHPKGKVIHKDFLAEK